MAQRKITVNAGDTYMGIAQRELGDVTQARMLQKNNGRLRAGMEIELPDPASTTPVTGSQAGQQAATTTAQSASPVANAPTPPLATSGTTPIVAAPSTTPPTPTPPLSTSGQTPIYDPRTTATSPNGIGAPNVGKPMYQGGKQTFDIFDKMKQGIISPTQTPVTPAEKEAVAMYQNYQKYQNADAQTLLGAIQSGELTPDKTNLLWRALGENGEPTEAMIQAYAMWDKGIKAGANSKRTKDPFLGGDWQKIQSEEDANAMINDFSSDDDTVDGEVVSSTDGGTSTGTGTVTKGTSEYDMYRQTIIDMMAQQPTGGSDYQGQLAGLRSRYNVQQDEQGLQALDDEAMAIENDLVARRNAARSQPVAMGVIAGRVGEIEKQQMERLNQVNRDRQYLANSLAQKQSIIGSMMDAYGADYKAAQDDFDSKYNHAMDAINMFRQIKKDETDEKAAMANAALAQKKFEEEKTQKRKDDASAKLKVIYDAIGDGTMDPNLIKNPAMALQMAQLEIQSGYPIGTFTGMMSKNPDKKIQSTVESINEKGEKILSFVMTDRNGTPTVVQKNLGVDAKALMDLNKGANEISMFGVDKKLKEQQLMNSILTGQKSYIDIAKDMTATPSDFINPKNSAYGIAVATDGSLVLNIQKNDKGEYKTLPGREQCGAFVNDALGLTGANRMPDSFEGKAALATQGYADVGSAFVQKLTGKFAANGHTGIVTKTYPDGSIDYINANENGAGDGTITTGHMTVEEMKQKGIVGFTPGYKNVLTGKSKMTDSERKDVEAKDLRTKASAALASTAGADGYVSPDVYRAAKKQWAAMQGDTNEFDQLYKDYINPTHYADYGVDKMSDTLREYFDTSASYATKKAAELKTKSEQDNKKKEDAMLKDKYAKYSDAELRALSSSAFSGSSLGESISIEQATEINKELIRRAGK